LCLTVANQYTAQMMQEVKDAVFGNVGSIISFRTSADDARIMLKYFEPKFEEHDLVHMHNRHFAISMTIGGEKVPAFSAISLNLPPFTTDYSLQIIEHSRSQYAQSRSFVEHYVAERYQLSENAPQRQSQPTPAKQPARQAPAVRATPKPVATAPNPGPVPTPDPSASAPAPAKAKAPSSPAAALSHAVLGRVAAPPPADAPKPTAPTEEAPAPKRKRTRRRKKKGDAPARGPTTAQIERAIEIEEGVIHLK
jgi:hypothetical protein